MTNRELELKACPFCGGSATLGRVSVNDGGYSIDLATIECERCPAKIQFQGYPTPDMDQQLTDLWNRRPEPAQAEPVAWMHFKHGLRGITVSASRAKELADMGIEVTPLYAAPQQEQK